MNAPDQERARFGASANFSNAEDARLVELAERKAARLGFRFVDVRAVHPSPQILRLVPADFARSFQILPIEFDQDRLVVAMSDPPSPEMSDRLRFALDHPVRVVLAVKEHLMEAIERAYGKGTAQESSPGAEAAEVPPSASVEFVEVREEEEAPGEAAAVDPESPEITRAIQSVVGEAIRLGATRAALVHYHGTTKVGYKVHDGICTRADIPFELLAPMAARMLAMVNFYGYVKVVARGTERKIRVGCRTTPYGLSLILDFDKDDSAVQAAREKAVLLGYGFDDLERVQIPAEVLATVPADIARAYHILPLSLKGDIVTLAFVEPPTPQLSDELRFTLGRPFEIVLAPEGRIRTLVERLYGPAEPEVVALLLAELARPLPVVETPRPAEWTRPVPSSGHLAEAVFHYLRQFATEKLLDLFEDIRRRPKLCIRSAEKWQVDVVIPRAEMISVLPASLRSYLENRLWLVRENIIARLFNILAQKEQVRSIALAYALYVAACRMSQGEREVPLDPVLLVDEWFNFLFCYALKLNPSLESNSGLLNYLTNHSEEFAERVAQIAEDPSLVQDVGTAKRWLENLSRQVVIRDLIDEKCGIPEAMLHLFVAEAHHYSASHMLILPRDEYLEIVYRVQNRLFATTRFPVCWFFPVLSRLMCCLIDHAEWQTSVAGQPVRAAVRLVATPGGLAALVEFRQDPRVLDTAQALAVSANCRFMRLHDIEVPPEALQLMDVAVARHLGLLPLGMEGDAVVIAMSQPPTARRLQELQILFNRPIEVVIAPEPELLAAIYRHYPPPHRFEASPMATYIFQQYTGLLKPGV
jgi:type II secretory ATPase GspE/PulE/Tfp pilus assembly ATPase PilB-like protein